MIATPESLKADGWERVELGGFSGVAGPFWMRADNGRRSLGFIIEDRHCNNHLGTIHGGMVMTFADMGLGVAVSDVLGHNRCATLSLQTQFVSVARIGEFITCKAEIIRSTRSIVFVRGFIMAEDRIVASSDGMWKVMEPRN
ncbi:MAG: PaaI family thioesterase [Spongiibacteraceae bacterium]